MRIGYLQGCELRPDFRSRIPWHVEMFRCAIGEVLDRLIGNRSLDAWLLDVDKSPELIEFSFERIANFPEVPCIVVGTLSELVQDSLARLRETRKCERIIIVARYESIAQAVRDARRSDHPFVAGEFAARAIIGDELDGSGLPSQFFRAVFCDLDSSLELQALRDRGYGGPRQLERYSKHKQLRHPHELQRAAALIKAHYLATTLNTTQTQTAAALDWSVDTLRKACREILGIRDFREIRAMSAEEVLSKVIAFCRAENAGINSI